MVARFGFLAMPAIILAMAERRMRVAAYGVCVEGERMLITRYVSQDRSMRHWTLPGGGVEHGEDPRDTVIRELTEETGLEVEPELLLGVDSRAYTGMYGHDMHAIGVFYRIRVVGGELRNEVGNSTDLALWKPVDEVLAEARAVIVDIGLALDKATPADGHTPSVEVAGLLRY
jgi:ADP-ribose pyrophosphatase YjhB (NUDIX family)